MDKLPQKGLVEFRHHPSHIRMLGEGLYVLKDLRNQPLPDFGHPLFRVPDPHLLEIAQ
jgi:hypothetical protein